MKASSGNLHLWRMSFCPFQTFHLGITGPDNRYQKMQTLSASIHHTKRSYLYHSKAVFKSIGIRNEIILISKPTLVENLIYASPQSSLRPLFMSGEMLDALAFRDYEERTDKKVWLSRTKLKYGRITNEQDIEERIAPT